MTKLPKVPRVYPNDINLLSFMFTLARNDATLALFLHELQFIRQHPMMTETQVRSALTQIPAKQLQ